MITQIKFKGAYSDDDNGSYKFLGNTLDLSLEIDDDLFTNANGIILRTPQEPIQSLKIFFKEHLHPVENGRVKAVKSIVLLKRSTNPFHYNVYERLYPFDSKEVEEILNMFYSKYPANMHTVLRDLRMKISENLEDSIFRELLMGFTYFFQANFNKALLWFHKSIERLSNNPNEDHLLKHITDQIVPLCIQPKLELLLKYDMSFLFSPDRGRSDDYTSAVRVLAAANLFFGFSQIVHTSNVRAKSDILDYFKNKTQDRHQIIFVIGHSGNEGISLYMKGTNQLFTKEDLNELMANHNLVFVDFTCYSDHFFNHQYKNNQGGWLVWNSDQVFHNDLAEYYILGFSMGIHLGKKISECHDLGNYCITFFSEEERKLELHEIKPNPVI